MTNFYCKLYSQETEKMFLFTLTMLLDLSENDKNKASTHTEILYCFKL